MHTELPVCKRCCFCLPLRYGLLTWGYLKLIAGSVLSIVLLVTLYNMIEMALMYRHNYTILNLTIISVVLAILLTDVVLNILFVIGGHQKNVKFLRVYYIYNLVLWALTFLLIVVCYFLMLPSVSSGNIVSYRAWLLLLDLSSSFVNIIMQTYFLLLLRSEIVKLRSNCEFRFVNNAAEAECTMKYKEVVANGERTEDICEKGTCESKDTCEKTCLSNGSCDINQVMNDDEI